MMMKTVILLLACVLALVSVSVVVQADLPIHCLNAQVSTRLTASARHSRISSWMNDRSRCMLPLSLCLQIAGDWVFSLDAGGHTAHSSGDLSGIACGYPQPDRNADHFNRPSILVKSRQIKVTLSEPNVAVDEEGNKGTWTMVYDEGFEVVVGGRTFFAYNKYVPNKGTSLTSDKVAHYTSHCDETMVGWYHDPAGKNWGCYRGKQTKAANAWTSAVTKVKDDGIDVAPVVSPNAMIEEFSRVLSRETDPGFDAKAEEAKVFLEEDAEVDQAEEAEAEDLISAFRPRLELAKKSAPHPRSAISSALPELDDSITFEPDHVFIERHNRNKRNTWKAKHHPEFDGKPVSAMLQMLGTRRFAKDVTGPASKQLYQPIKDARPDAEKYAGLPTHWDWSDRNGVSFDTEIRNQGSCGSCYAMASISALEARYRVKSHLAFRPILSPQDVVSCSFYNQVSTRETCCMLCVVSCTNC
jgi:hypothetical protein